MAEEFDLSKERRKLYEEELSGKITSAGRIYRKIIAIDKEFIRLLKEEVNQHGFNDEDGTPCIEDYNLFEIINTLTGEKFK